MIIFLCFIRKLSTASLGEKIVALLKDSFDIFAAASLFVDTESVFGADSSAH